MVNIENTKGLVAQRGFSLKPCLHRYNDRPLCSNPVLKSIDLATTPPPAAGEAGIGSIYEDALIEKDLKSGDLYRIQAGSAFYIVNTVEGQRLHIITSIDTSESSDWSAFQVPKEEDEAQVQRPHIITSINSCGVDPRRKTRKERSRKEKKLIVGSATIKRISDSKLAIESSLTQEIGENKKPLSDCPSLESSLTQMEWDHKHVKDALPLILPGYEKTRFMRLSKTYEVQFTSPHIFP
uniref:Uncharacterized protein n=1 Tax=Lactuca sativa TaxID=4236 RepID=A0A9R1XT49_LACSA|nr:hypothetical protein LSAT_V11C200072470 [Lactuca sativa]